MPDQSDTQDALIQRLADSGLRSTPQRAVVFQTLLEKRDHPTADEIFARVKAQLPTISLATVYNCLETLVTCGLIKQVNFERSPTRYCPNIHEHAHFHDDSTGRVHDISLPADVLSRLREILPVGFEANAIELTFRGRASATSAPAT